MKAVRRWILLEKRDMVRCPGLAVALDTRRPTLMVKDRSAEMGTRQVVDATDYCSAEP